MVSSATWSRLQNNGLGFMASVAAQLQERESRGFVSLRPCEGKRVLIASDFGGEHRQSQFHTTSILICDLANAGAWFAAQADVRKRFLPDARRMGYKELSDGYCQQALLPFLEAANLIPGLCVTFAVDKALGSIFPSASMFEDGFSSAPGGWRAAAFEKLMRVTNFSSLLLALLTQGGEDIIWISDEDDIAANDTMYAALPKAIGRVLNCYLDRPMGHLRTGTTQRDDGSRSVEDIVAIPDLLAGAAAYAVSEISTCGRLGSTLAAALPTRLPPKVEYIVQWLGMRRYPLQRLVFVMRSTHRRKCALSWLEIAGGPAVGIMVPQHVHIDRLRGRW